MKNSFVGVRTPAWSLLLGACLILLAIPGVSLATVITATPQNFSAGEQAAFNGPVAVFSDDNPAAAPADFNALIDWGDGTPLATGTIAVDDTAFFVLGTHTYADEGTFTVSVTISDNPPGTGIASVTDTATITEADVLSGTPRTFPALQGVSFTTTVATFSDASTTNAAGDFTATINWGDTTTSVGTVSGGSGSFQVGGTHTYAAPGNFSVVVTLSDDAPGTATAQTTSTANVSSILTTTAVNISATEHTAFSGTVATFTDSDLTKTPASFTAVITWGDGTSTPGTIAGGNGSFSVSGLHTYADEGSFSLNVAVAEAAPGTATSTGNATASVREGDVLSGTPVAISAVVGTPFSGPVANFTDTDTGNTVGDFNVTINWGDGTTTAANVTGSAGAYQVSGTHTYASAGSFSAVVTLSDDAPGTATAQVTSTANVVNGTLSATALNVATSERVAFTGSVATFTDTNTSQTASSFTATVNWGDGATTAGTIAGSAGSFTVSGQHTYADEGSFPLSVTVAEIAPGTATSTATATSTVGETDVLSGTPVSLSATTSKAFTGVVANFTDTDTTATSSDFVATIQWGDGTTGAGVISGSGGTFQVSGTHTYATSGAFSVVVTLSDDAPGTATASVTSSASSAAVTPPAPAVGAPMLEWYGAAFLAFLLGVAGVKFGVRRKVRGKAG